MRALDISGGKHVRKRRVGMKLLYHAPLLKHDHPVCAGNGLRSMRYEHLGYLQLLDRLIDQSLTHHVEVTGGFIQKQQLRLTI